MSQLILKIILISVVVALMIKVLGPFAPQSVGSAVVLAIVLSPSVVLGFVLLKQSRSQ
ncbi:MAG: hypothetical protein AAGB01_06895 [Cyanobacteria bacterium P01_F01_bin.42]